MVMAKPKTQAKKTVILTNFLTQKLVVNVIIDGVERSVELASRETRRLSAETDDLGPHAAALKRGGTLGIRLAL